MKYRTVEDASPDIEKSPEFQRAEAAGVRIGLLDQLEQLPKEFIAELKIVVEDYLLSHPAIPLDRLLIDNFRLIAEVVKYIEDEDKERRDIFNAFLNSLYSSTKIVNDRATTDNPKKTTSLEKLNLAMIRKWFESHIWGGGAK